MYVLQGGTRHARTNFSAQRRRICPRGRKGQGMTDKDKRQRTKEVVGLEYFGNWALVVSLWRRK